MTQRERVLEALRQAGENGLHSFWGYQNYIPRLGAIIFDLKKMGYEIKSLHNKKDSGCTYWLISEPESHKE
jgi:hypothetical protein